MNILVVDDEQNILRTTCIALKTMGHNAFQASSSRQAERVLNEEPIDAIILDMMLGNENGLDYLDKLEAAGNHPPGQVGKEPRGERTVARAQRDYRVDESDA